MVWSSLSTFRLRGRNMDVSESGVSTEKTCASMAMNSTFTSINVPTLLRMGDALILAMSASGRWEVRRTCA